ncbi:hypothetical protein [Cupriavidus sp. D384]|uniref:hypothetical protein n=1 Tax=Cupriavidus sp. D384 TaxID=1538095 RepID=UPI0012E8D902|nr:hypothetical protein [Cupriavidus sp. D384]
MAGALVGAAAIVFTLVTFAMQVNVDRLPNFLFQRMGRDSRLLGSFVAAIGIAFFVGALSLLPDTETWPITGLVATFWSLAATVVIYHYAHRRSLLLVSPIEQIKGVVKDAERNQKRWRKHADRFVATAESVGEAAKGDDDNNDTFDPVRFAFFQQLPSWDTGARVGVQNLVALGETFAVKGDSAVVSFAYDGIVAVNRSYIQTKGRTFISQSLFSDGGSTDAIVNVTLEALRRIPTAAIARHDEVHLSQVLRVFRQLSELYLTVDYGSPYREKWHATLAAGYLDGAIASIMRTEHSDVLMNAAREAGNLATAFIGAKRIDNAHGLVTKLGELAKLGLTKDVHVPVAMIASEQIARIAITLLRSRSRGSQFVGRHLQQTMDSLLRSALLLPGTGLSSRASQCLGPYFSLLGGKSFPSALSLYADHINEGKLSDDDAMHFVRNVLEWTERRNHVEKETLLLAVAARSNFAHELLMRLTQLCKVLMGLSLAPVCDESLQEELLGLADRYICVFSFLPDDPDSVKFLENIRVIDSLAELAVFAKQSDRDEVLARIREMMLDWILKSGRYHTGWGSLGNGLFSVIVLATVCKDLQIMDTLRKALTESKITDDDVLDTGIRDLREALRDSSRNWRHSPIDWWLAKCDRSDLRGAVESTLALLRELRKGSESKQ